MPALYPDQVKRATRFISPAVTAAAEECGLPAAMDALSTILTTLLIASLGGDRTREALGRLYQEVARLEEALGSARESAPHQLGRA
jgi:hypothetical protein